MIGALTVLAGDHIHEASRNIVFADEWAYVGWLGKILHGHGGWPELWTQHNQSRVVILRLLLLGSARFDALDVQHLKYLGLFFACLTAGLLVLYGITSLRGPRRMVGAWALVPVAALLLGLQQWENLTWGEQCVYFLTTTSAVAAILLFEQGLRAKGHGALWLALAIVMALTSSLSASSGLATWPVLLLQAFLPGRRNDRRTKAFVIGVVGAILWITYLWGFQGGSVASILSEPVKAMGYCLALLGSSIKSSTYAGIAAGDVVVGSILLVGMVWCVFTYFQRQTDVEAQTRERPLIVLIVYSLLVVGIVSAGRLGVAPPDTSRYSTLIDIGPAALLTALVLRSLGGSGIQLTPLRSRLALLTVMVAVLGVIGFGVVRSDVAEVGLTSARAAYFADLVKAIDGSTAPTDAQLQPFDWPPTVIRQSLPTLCELHLNAFAHGCPTYLATSPR